VIESKKGLLLCMPSRKTDDGGQRDVAHPINKEFRSRLEREIFTEYDRVINRAERGDNEKILYSSDDDYDGSYD
jgi:stage V sporulation protein G